MGSFHMNIYSDYNIFRSVWQEEPARFAEISQEIFLWIFSQNSKSPLTFSSLCDTIPMLPRLGHIAVYAGVMELADVTDSKSVDGDIVWVRVPPPAPKKEPCEGFLFAWWARPTPASRKEGDKREENTGRGLSRGPRPRRGSESHHRHQKRNPARGSFLF